MSSNQPLGGKSLPSGLISESSALDLQLLKVAWIGKLFSSQEGCVLIIFPPGQSEKTKQETRLMGPTHGPPHSVGGNLPGGRQGFSTSCHNPLCSGGRCRERPPAVGGDSRQRAYGEAAGGPLPLSRLPLHSGHVSFEGEHLGPTFSRMPAAVAVCK